MGDRWKDLICGRMATLAADEVVAGQPQAARSGRQAASYTTDKCLVNQYVTSIEPASLKLAEALLSLKRLSQPPSERS